MKVFLFYIKKIILYILLLPVYYVSAIMPKDNKLWVFGAWFGSRYSDNPRYLFEYIQSSDPEIRAVWLTRKQEIADTLRRQNKEAYLINSFKGCFITCRAALLIISSGLSDINRYASAGNKKVHLTHGIPLKKIGFDDTKSTYPPQSFFFRALRKIWYLLFPFMEEDKWDMAIASSSEVAQKISSAYGVKKSQVKITGYPRTDVILNREIPLSQIFEKMGVTYNAQKIVCYIPTFRNNKNKNDEIINALDFEKLNRILEERNALFLIKMHYVRQNDYRDSAIQSYNRIIFLSEENLDDINRLLPFVDILITDYSSVYFDYLLLNRPIIFTPFDLEEYNKFDRELYYNYDEATPGVKCYNWREVFDALENIFDGNDFYEKERLKVLKMFYERIDSNNSRRITAELKKYIALS